MDLRKERTNVLLMQALIELLKEKTFEKITVSELCERAMIRRVTFYKHFSDKYDLYAYVVRTLKNQFEDKNDIQINKNDLKSFQIAMFDSTLKFVEQYPYIIKSLLQSNLSQLLFDILSNEIEKDVLYHLQNKINVDDSMIKYPEVTATMMTGAMINVIKWWTTSNNNIPRTEIIRVYEDFFNWK